jgi:hypothetical protein
VLIPAEHTSIIVFFAMIVATSQIYVVFTLIYKARSVPTIKQAKTL